MRRIYSTLALAGLLVGLAACQSSGSSRVWDVSGASQTPAQSSPQTLDRNAVYQPYYTPQGTPVQGEGAAQVQAPGQFTIGDSRTPQAQVNAPHGGYEAAEPPSMQMASMPLAPVKVGLLLPLSGPHAALGQDMLQAAQMALFDMGYEQFELMPRDTQGSAQTAAQAAQMAVNDGAQILLGPVFAQSVQAVKPVARRANINMISYTTDWAHGDMGTFIMGFLPFAQVQRVTEFALVKGYRNFAVIAPQTKYGNAVANIFQNTLRAQGLPQPKILNYSPGRSDMSEQIKAFTMHEAREAGKDPVTGISAVPMPFDAVLIAAGGEDARTIANLLSFYDMGPDQVKRLGTGLWDENSLSSERALEGAWFATSDPSLRRNFEQRYLELFQKRPQRLATLAYDSTALVAVLARNGIQQTGKPSFGFRDLTNPNGFSGVDGVFRFRNDGLVERGLAVLEIDASGNRVIDPARRTFQQIGQ